MRRLGAFAIDLAIYWAVFWVVRIFVPMPLYPSTRPLGPVESHPYWLLWAAPLVFSAVYSIGLHGSSLQGTFGKVLCRIAVVNLKGEPIGYAKALARFLIMAIYVLMVVLVTLGLILSDFSKNFFSMQYIPQATFIIMATFAASLVLVRRGNYKQSLHHRLLRIYLIRRDKVAVFTAIPKV